MIRKLGLQIYCYKMAALPLKLGNLGWELRSERFLDVGLLHLPSIAVQVFHMQLRSSGTQVRWCNPKGCEDKRREAEM